VKEEQVFYFISRERGSITPILVFFLTHWWKAL